MPARIHIDNYPGYYSSRHVLKEITADVLVTGAVRHIGDDEDMTDPTVQDYLLRIVTLHGGLSADDVRSVIGRGMAPSRCACEHDCCGHRYGYADTEFLAPDLIKVTVHTARNF